MIFDEQKLNSLSAAYTNWEQTTLKKTLDRMPESRETFVTQSSVPIKRAVYAARHRPISITCETWAFPVNTPSRAASMPPAIAAGCGRCACSRALARPKKPTPATNICSNRAIWAYPSPSIWPR